MFGIKKVENIYRVELYINVKKRVEAKGYIINNIGEAEDIVYKMEQEGYYITNERDLLSQQNILEKFLSVGY